MDWDLSRGANQRRFGSFPRDSQGNGLGQHLVSKEGPQERGCPYLHLDAEHIFQVTTELEKIKRTRFGV